MISVIVPFYNGNQYLEKLLKNLDTNAKNLFTCTNTKTEIVLVNDSPWIEPVYSADNYSFLDIVLLTNEQNSGIQKSRINGINKASNEYIILLDQDDELSNDAFLSYYDILKEKDYDLIISNGVLELDYEHSEPIFGSEWDHNLACNPKAYLKIRDFIASPGQCLIKKTKIPTYWMENVLVNNGTDDYLLWLLMFNENVTIQKNMKQIYVHKFTGQNLSNDNEKMRKSEDELIQILQKNQNYDKKSLNTFLRCRDFKRNYKLSKINFIVYSLKYLDLFIYNVYYRLKWKGVLYK